ncbi:hypothetical protein FOZ60_017287, partial [Perkinsus olseni]
PSFTDHPKSHRSANVFLGQPGRSCPRVVAVLQVNKQDEDGNTALHLAVKKNDFSMTRLLLSWGASELPRNKEGKKPFDLTTVEPVLKLLEIHKASAKAEREWVGKHGTWQSVPFPGAGGDVKLWAHVNSPKLVMTIRGFKPEDNMNQRRAVKLRTTWTGRKRRHAWWPNWYSPGGGS